MAWRQAIIWTNADSIHWRIYATLAGDELSSVAHILCVLQYFSITITNGNDSE